MPPDHHLADAEADTPRVTKPYEGEVVVDLLKEARLTRLIRAVLTQLD